MSFPAYPSYRASSAEWLGDVPSHWTVLKVKGFAQFAGGGTPSREKPEYWNGDIPWVSPKDMKQEVVSSSEEKITAEGLASSAASEIAPGAVLVVVRSGILRHTIPVAINSVPVALNQDMKALRLDPSRCDPRFLFRWIQGLNDPLLLAWSKQGATVESIEHQYLAETLVPLPTLAEQATIAAFLDRETTKIDALVAEQRRLIELLKEKRQAVISHAVTKGLNPDAPMKDSGVEWLGDIPAHWQVKRLKHLSPAITVGIVVDPSTYTSDEGLPFIFGGDISPGVVHVAGARRISPERSASQPKTILRAGDLVTVRVGAPGITAVVPPGCEGGNCASVMLVRKGSRSSEWLCYVMNSDQMKFQVELIQYGAAQKQFNISHAVNFVVVTPPALEAEQIAARLDAELANISALSAQAEAATALLNERRAALIAAVVTGKVDVRGAMPQEAEAA